MPREIPLTQGRVAIVDDGDYESLSAFKWYAYKGRSTFYAQRHDGNSTITMHVAILGRSANMRIDHRDGNGLNNTRANLRFATEAQNQANHEKHFDNRSGYKGVHWDSSHRAWRAEICINHKKVFLGYFNSPIAAAMAYNSAARNRLGGFARTNVITRRAAEAMERQP